MDARRRAKLFLVPFDRNSDQFAVAIAFDDVDERHGRQRALARQALAAFLQHALGGE